MSDAVERHLAMNVNCGACWSSVQFKDMASMIDRNGHRWYICPACIDALWHLHDQDKQRLITPGDTPAEASVESVRFALATLVGFVNGLYDIINPLPEIPVGVKDATLKAMDDARKFYSDDTH